MNVIIFQSVYCDESPGRQPLTICSGVWYTPPMTRAGFVERKGRIDKRDRSFDLRFWQAQSPEARFNAAWELVVHYAMVKGLDARQLRLQRTIETFQRQQR